MHRAPSPGGRRRSPRPGQAVAPGGHPEVRAAYVDGERWAESGLLEGGPPGRGGDLRRGAARWAAARVVPPPGSGRRRRRPSAEASGGANSSAERQAGCAARCTWTASSTAVDRLHGDTGVEELRSLRWGSGRGWEEATEAGTVIASRQTPLANCMERSGSGRGRDPDRGSGLPEGRKTGPARTWYSSGSAQSEGRFDGGARRGRWIYRERTALNEAWSGLYEDDVRVAPLSIRPRLRAPERPVPHRQRGTRPRGSRA